MVSVAALSERAATWSSTARRATSGRWASGFAKRTPIVAAAIAAADASALSAALRESGTAVVVVEGEEVEVAAEEVIVTETPREGWTVAGQDGATVALDLTITPELRLAGLARDVVRLIQEARKNSGLEVSDRILVWWAADESEETTSALLAHGVQVADEVLATQFTPGRAGGRGVVRARRPGARPAVLLRKV